MCHDCDKEVIEMGILESDLPNLPYTPVRWFCMVEGCKCKTTVRDYGIAPLYYWPVRIRRDKDGTWYGGWASCLHGYICSRHFKEYKANRKQFCYKYARDQKQMLSRIQPIIKKKK